ncbi:hypothetical protein OKW96_10120 [Sphingobacterium sp. KU25419]|nr:hypothetical protein OKW96_10120 [Sphingobacterium sp. KU25419]
MKAMFRNVWILFVMLFALATVNANTRLHLDVDQYKQLEFLSTLNTSIQLPEISPNSHHIALFQVCLKHGSVAMPKSSRKLTNCFILPSFLSGYRQWESGMTKNRISVSRLNIGVILNPRYILFKCIKIPI